MKKIFFPLFFLSIIFIDGCSEPTEVDAYRRKTFINPPTDVLTDLWVNPTYIDFGRANINFSKSEKISILNNSQLDSIKIDTLSFARNIGCFSFRFAQGNFPILLGPRERALGRKEIEVEFWPQEYGDYIDTLFFNKSKSKFIVMRGVARDPGELPEIELETSKDINFGDMEIGWEKEVNFILTNKSNYSVTILGFQPSGQGSGFDYSVTYPIGGKFPIKLAPYYDTENNHTGINLRFSPSEIKNYSQKLIFLTDATTEPIEVGNIIARGIPKK